MSSPLNMDPQQIASNAAKLDELAQRRKQHEQQVTDIASQIAPMFTGEAATALQTILNRYVATAQALRDEEAALAEKLDSAQKAYTDTDAGGADALRSAMGI
ncbi:WXG100 family type VII secretion target [Mycobacterium deserti]|uniref:WXG100 family type VII secretion target n=1 Tax=Mycobacterium deserti TaxID=2978347 RepID=A0ABT2M8Q5_9MYCO|nr:WXG100 family type VII secretion target [Mycobacterium deserti]MCT7658648.1 WXG100 family type VII secretion target [Mycobacterium deserti]